MNGCVMVLPRNGLNDGRGNRIHYDKAFYIGEQRLLPQEDRERELQAVRVGRRQAWGTT